MSRVAKIPVVLGKGVEAKIENGFITVKGPKGTLSQKLNPVVEVTILSLIHISEPTRP